ncbi:MAG: MG2 domain-containing protein, partial [Bacteroidales bacterium]|nr:MG2 domain-containing protein [Bacteroidales bacterium]
MKTKLLIIGALVVSSLALLSFQKTDKDYNEMWKKVKESIENNLPETAEKQLNEIESAAKRDKNQPQLLKTVLYRQQIFRQKEEDPEKAFLAFAESKMNELGKTETAVLHLEIAKTYAGFYEQNQWQLRNNLPIDGDMSQVELKYWDEKTFRKVIDQHYTEALKDKETLKNAKTNDYLILFEDQKNVYENLDYEKTMFEYVFHRVAKYYKEIASADDIQPDWNTEIWWADAKDFVKADLGDSDNGIIKCLKIFQELIAYNQKENNEDVLLYNDVKRYQFVNGILVENDIFNEKLNALMQQYAENPMSAEIASVYANSLVDNYSESDSSTFGNYRKAFEICQNTIEKFPKSKGASQCKDIVKFIENDEINVQMQETQLPNQAIALQLRYRNAEHPYYKIVKVTEDEINSYLNLDGDELFKKLDGKKPAAEQELALPAETDFCSHSTLVALPQLSVGQYYIIAKTSKDAQSSEKRAMFRFQVSNLSYVTNNETDAITLFTLDRKTGKPLANVKVELYTRNYNYKIRKYENTKLADYQSDNNGKVSISNVKGNNSFFVNLRNGDDALLSGKYMNVPHPNSRNSEIYSTTFFTDRAIYRPGQTVYFKGIVVRHQGDDMALAEGFSETVRFRDANYEEISSLLFTTDEYGSFDGSFVIPTDRLNGVFRLDGSHGSTTIRVEEYKRPTFEVNFEKPKEQYKLNQDVTIHGSVDAYAGFGLDDVKYTYRVTRRTSFPWRCWWWFYPVVSDEQIDFGEARTDESGKFAITFNLKPSLKTKPEQQPVFTYEIEVTATSAQGETHSETYSIRAGYNEICLSTNLNNLVEKSQLENYRIEVLNMSGQPAKSKVSRKFYRFNDNGKMDFFEASGQRSSFDRQVMSDEELTKAFPDYDYYSYTNRLKNKVLVYEDVVEIDEKTALFPEKADLKSGKYYVELQSLDDKLAMNSTEFTLFDDKAKALPHTTLSWNSVDKSTAKPGETITFSIGTSTKDTQIWVQLLSGQEKRMEKWLKLNNEITKLSYKVTENDRGGLTWKTIFVKDGLVKTESQSIYVPYDNLDLNVELATVRDVLRPGAEEHWEVTVRDYHNKPVASSMLAGMYDASLDVFASNSWYFNMKPYTKYANSFDYDDQFGFVSSSTNGQYIYLAALFGFSLPSDYPFFDFGYMYYGRAKGGVMFNRSVALDCVAEECAELKEMPMPAPSAKKMSSNEVADGAMTDEEVLQTEEIGASEAQQEAVPTVRENFNETAFFFPNLRTNADGSTTFSFTMPDALTRWKLMMLAYTKDRKTGYKTYDFKSSKPVMIMADMPRYMYDGDTLWLVANVINTGEEAVTPKAKLEVFDAASMKPVNILASDAMIAMEEIVPGRSKEVRWKVAAKKDLGLLAFRFTAFAGQFSDAEQHLLPVLSSEIFMTQTLPITVKAETEKSFDFESIANSNSHEHDYSLTLNFSTNPVWYAVQSLPYLADQRTDRAESAFYVFYANTLSSYIASKIPNLLNYIKKWQIETPDALLSQLEKDQDLKAIMLRETPWVMEAKSETEQRSRISTLFEINTLSQNQTSSLKLIAQKQTSNGGWPWMKGMSESPYISTYILSGFGRLKAMDALSSLSKANQNTANQIIDNAVRYLEYEVADTYRRMRNHKKEWPIDGSTLNELYALSFFPEQKSDKSFAEAKKYFLGRLEKEWTDFDFNMRSKAAVLLFRSGNEKTAKLMIQSFKECAQKDEAIGMYWPKKYFSFESHIATHANIMAAFAEIENDTEMLDQLRVWLLTQKQTNQWENSASTAEAVYALLLRGTDWLNDDKEVTLKLGNQQIDMDGAVAGTGFIQRRWNANEVTEDMRHLTVNNPTKHLVWGGLFRQYFVPIDEVKSDESAFKISRELFVEKTDENGKILVPIEKQALKVGDKLTVKITFESKQDMEYVFVKDLRAAGFEPIEQISHYEHNDQMSYYQTNTDTDMEFFIEFLPKGTHQVEYSMFVTKEGNLSNGYAL